MPRAERLAALGLLAAMVLSATAFLVLGHELTPWSDELDWLTLGDDFTPETLLTPHNSHLIALPRAIYELLPRLFGTSYLPFRLIALVAVLACAALLFILVRKRVGGVLALGCATIVLFFGSAPDMALSAVAIPFTLSIAFGLGALVAFDRDRPRADVAGLVLLVLATLSHTFGVIIAAGIAIQLLAEESNRRRAWTALLPVALWVAWWIWARQFDQDITDAVNLAGAPLFVIESAGAALAAVSGAGPSFGEGADFLEGPSLVLFSLAALAGAGLLFARIRRSAAGPWLLGFVAIALAFWIGTALSETDARRPTTPRYLFFGAIMVMLIVAEGLRTRPLGRRLFGGAAVILAVGIVLNVARLGLGAERLQEEANEVRVQLAMIELAGENATPAFSPATAGAPGSEQIGARAGELDEFTGRHGPLGASLEEVAEASESLRRGADFVLTRSLGFFAAPVPPVAATQAGGCQRFSPGADGSVRFDLPSGVSLIRAREDGSLLIGRFADSASVYAGELAGAGSVISIPEDAYPRDWYGVAAEAVRVCEFGAGAGTGGSPP